jgi:hypothetical protein
MTLIIAFFHGIGGYLMLPVQEERPSRGNNMNPADGNKMDISILK